MKVVRSALDTDRLYPQKTSFVLTFVRGLMTIVRPKLLRQRKIQITPSGIEPATFRLVGQCLNQMRHRVAPKTSLNTAASLSLKIVIKYPIYETGLRIKFSVVLHWQLAPSSKAAILLFFPLLLTKKKLYSSI